jgi:hypothetical protein
VTPLDVPTATDSGAPKSLAVGSHLILEGDEALRRWWVRRHLPMARVATLSATLTPNERIELISAVEPGLFGPPPALVLHCDAPVAVISDLLTAFDSSVGTVVFSSARYPRQTLGFTTLQLPRPGSDPRGWQQLAADLGVTLDRAGVDLLRRRCGDDVGRGLAALELCVLGRIHTPNAKQLEALLISSSEPVVPWTLGDHIEAGRADALELCQQTEPLVIHAYLSRRWQRALQLLEGDQPADQRDQRLAEFGRRHGESRLQDALHVLAESDFLLKTHQHDALRIMVVRLLAVFTR